MSKNKNFFLMLKQGLKGVFQFKAQFIIIIILTFVATFILSISVSTQRSMEDSFNRIVKPIDKFNYQGNIQAHSDANASSDPFMLANELDTATPTEYKLYAKTDGKSNGKKTIVADNGSFNFVFYNGSDNNWYKDSDGNNVVNFLTEGTSKFIATEKNAPWSDNKNKTNYFTDLNREYFRSLFNELTQIADLKKNNKQLKDFYSLTKYSPIAIYTYNNPDWLKPFKFNSQASSLTDMFAWTGSENAKDRDIFNNVANGIATLTGFLSGTINDTKSTIINSKINSKINSNSSATQFLFGTKLKDESPVSDKWVISDSVKPYSLNVNAYISDEGKEYTFAEINDDAKTADAAIYKDGLRGISNPMIVKSTNNVIDIQTLSSWNDFDWLSFNQSYDSESNKPALANMYSNMSVTNGDYYSVSLNANMANLVAQGIYKYQGNAVPLETVFRAHNKLSAAAAGFDFKLRREVTYFDANKQLKFRAIVLNKNENYNFTILHGRYPSTGEVAISEQFARKNKVKVGSFISVGDALYEVSAIATDALSYLPSQDLSNPIPNPRVSSFLYADSATIDKIWAGTKENSGDDASVTQNLSYFLYSDSKYGVSGALETRKNAYLAMYSNQLSTVIENTNATREFVNTGSVTKSVGSALPIQGFDKSPYRYSWSLQPLVFKVYDAVTFTAAAIIAIISLAAVIVCVKKTIDLNSKQIGILKALGEKPSGISVNYLSYALILGIIVVPVAWVAGNILQIPFGNMFLTYFSIEPNVVTWDWISFVIAFGLLGIGSGIFSFLTAWLITNKPVLSILGSSVKWGRLRFVDWLKNKVFRRAPFSTRFSLTLTSSGSRQIILMSVVMFVASLLMSAVLAIPSVVVRINNTYYKSVKYANKYDDWSMIGNAPLSKNAISYWDGHDYLDDQYVNAGLSFDNSGAKYGYYKDPEAYTSTNSNATAFPQYIYDANTIEGNSKGNGINDFDKYVLANTSQILSIVGTVFGNNYFTHLGVSFSVGMVDKIYGLILHSYQDVTNMNNGKAYTDEKKLSEAQNLSSWLTSSIPKIIGAIVDSNAKNSNEGAATGPTSSGEIETWKEKVMDTIYKVIPSYVKAYVQKSDSRLDQFGISFQNDMYIPGQETLATTVDGNVSQYADMALTGIDKYQNSLMIDSKDKDKVFLTEKDKKELMNRINVPMKSKGVPYSADDKDSPLNNSYVAENGMLLYDGNTHTFNIPVLPNKQAASAYKLNKGKSFNGWNNNLQEIQVTSQKGTQFNLPSLAWIYDDSDYANYLANSEDKLAKQEGKDLPYLAKGAKYDSSDPNNGWEYEITPVKDKDGKDVTAYYLEPSRLDNNKLTFTDEFATQDNKPTLKDRAILFKNFKFDKDGNPIGTYVRPEYQYKNFKLMIPKSWVNEDELLYSDHKVDTKHWFDDSVSANNIPQSVKDGYEKTYYASNKSLGTDPKDDTWIVINPYDLNYYEDDHNSKTKMALTNLVDGVPYWYRYAFAGNSILSVSPNVTMEQLLADSQGIAANSKEKTTVSLNSVGTIESYNDKLIVCDSDIANMLMGYPNYRDYQYNYQTFNKSTLIPAGQEWQGTKSEFDRYAYTDTSTDKFVVNDWNTDKDKEADLWQMSYDKYKADLDGSITNYAPHLFYNTKLSNIDEPLDYTSQISFTNRVRIGQTAIALGDAMPGGTISIVRTSTLLSTTKALIHQLAILAFAIGSMLMVAIIITAALLIMLTGDIYIEQYKRFMVLLRALGYSKTQIFVYTFAPVSIFSFLAWAGGTILAWGLIYIGVGALWSAGLAIPMGITWWPIVLSFLIMFLSYAGSLSVSGSKTRKANPSEVLTATAE